MEIAERLFAGEIPAGTAPLGSGDFGPEKGEGIGTAESFRGSVFPEDGRVLAFTGDGPGEHQIAVLGADGRWLRAGWKDIGPQFTGNPGNGFVVFKVIEGAGGIQDPAAGLEDGPDVPENAAGTGCAEFHCGRGPFGHGLGVFPEHPLAGAGDIGHDHVEKGRLSESQRIL